MTMLSAPLKDALRLYRDLQTADPDAIDEVRELFPPDSECFLCAQSCGTERPGLFVGEDPRDKHLAIVAPLCAAHCMSLTYQERLRRIRVMLTAMFPRLTHRINPVPTAALRRLG
jgi:hypothetical protein